MSHPVSAELTVLDALPGSLWFGAWRNVNVVVWLQAAKPEVVGRVDRAIGARFDKLKERMSTIHVVGADAGPPESDARDALVEMNERLAHTVACGAVVIEKGGLMGIAVRSAITGMIIVAPKHYRVKVFDAIDPCASWVAEQHKRVTSTQLEAADVLETLRYARKTAK